MAHPGGGIRVLLWHRADAAGPAAVEQAYHRVSADLSGTPGLLGNQLLRSRIDSDAFLVMSEWTSLAAFQRWEQGAAHRGTTAPLRAFRDVGRTPSYDILETVAEYR